jgi:AcrR family transcriptional regulator
MTKREKPLSVASAGAEVQASAARVLPHVEFDETPGGKILSAAREILLREGYSALTMDLLCSSLSMSKKTLYVHFSSKDEMVIAIFAATGATLRQGIDDILSGPGGFIAKLHVTLRLVGDHFGSLSPSFLADLQRYAPELYSQIDEIKAKNIPRGLTPILKLGVAEGLVRDDESIAFLIECWLLVASGLHDPLRLERLKLDAEEAFNRAMDVFLGGILTAAGRTRLRTANE